MMRWPGSFAGPEPGNRSRVPLRWQQAGTVRDRHRRHFGVAVRDPREWPCRGDRCWMRQCGFDQPKGRCM